MVRSSLHVCFFCDDYRPNVGAPLSALRKLVEQGSGSHDDDDSAEEFEEPARRMVQELTDSEARTHAASPQHRARMSGVLRNREECDRVTRETRPTEQETQEKSRCMEDLKQTLKPQEFHWTGSVGKSTALRGAHDLDVCVKLGPAFDGKAAVDEIARRLSGSPFVVVRKEAALVFVRYGSLELDIIPNVRQSLTHDKWTSQVGHLRLFKQMDPALKDVVRLVKAWARLCVPVPGILIECVVAEVGRLRRIDGGSLVQKSFIQVLHMLSLRRQWIDPHNPENDLSLVLPDDMWHQLSSYAKSTLQLSAVSAVEIHGLTFMTFPSSHEVRLVFEQERDMAPIELGRLDGFEIAELCTRLALRLPQFCGDATFFDRYDKPKRVKDAAKSKSTCWAAFANKSILEDLLKRELWRQADMPQTDLHPSTERETSTPGHWLFFPLVILLVLFIAIIADALNR